MVGWGACSRRLQEYWVRSLGGLCSEWQLRVSGIRGLRFLICVLAHPVLSPHSQVPMVPGPDSGPTAPAVFYALISPLCSAALSLPLAPQPPPPFIPCQRSWVGEGPPLPGWRSFICNLMLAPGTRGQGHCWNERGGQRGLLEEGDGGREDAGGRVRALSL